MPICDAMYRILIEKEPLGQVISGLLQRAARVEQDVFESAHLWK